MNMNRRKFLSRSAQGMATAAVASFVMPHQLLASGSSGKTVVFIDNLGAMDALAALQPTRNSALAKLNDDYLSKVRPNLLSPLDDLVALQGMPHFALHPGMQALQDIWKRGDLSIVMNAGFERINGQPNANLRSHFEQMRNIQLADSSGTHREGLFNRTLAALPASTSAYHAVAIQSSVPVALVGSKKVTAITDIGSLTLSESSYSNAFGDFMSTLANMYRNSHQAFGGGLFAELADSTKAIIQEGRSLARASNIGSYNMNQAFHRNLKTAADLIVKGNGQSRIIHVPGLGGLDTHNLQAPAPVSGEDSKTRKGHQGALAGILTQFAEGLRAFMDDLEAAGKSRDVVIVAMSEFSRTVRQNGNFGTDHGGGTNIFVLGRPVSKQFRYLNDSIQAQNESAQYADPSLGGDAPVRGSDLYQAFDFRRVFAEVFVKHLGVPAAKIPGLFPGLVNPNRYLDLLA